MCQQADLYYQYTFVPLLLRPLCTGVLHFYNVLVRTINRRSDAISEHPCGQL